MSELALLLPVGLFLAAAVLCALLPRGWSFVITLATPIISALVALQVMQEGQQFTHALLDYTLVPVAVDALGLLMMGLFHLAAFIGALFIAAEKDRLQHGAMLAYFAGGMGAVMAGDWISFFVFFEIIALAGAGLVFARRTEQSTQAGVRYFLFQVGAGVMVLAGLLMNGLTTGQWLIGPVSLSQTAGWFLLIGLGIKAGFPLLHIWLVDAYPKASLAGLSVLVAVTTKVGIVALMKVFPGEAVLVPIGTVMALWPIVYVLNESDLRRVLAYSMMIQLGLMVVAVGVGTPTALDGVSLHIAMDVLFKMTLFMALALVLANLGTTHADQLKGLGKHWPVVAACVAVASLANMAIPFTGGFVSKKLMLSAIETSTLPQWLYFVLVSLSVVGLLYAWVRITWRVFFQAADAHSLKPSKDALPRLQLLALLLPVTLLVLTGFVPGLLDGLRPFGSDTDVVTAKKIISQLLMLGTAGLVYWLLAKKGLGLPTQRLARMADIGVVYRFVLTTLPQAIAQKWRTGVEATTPSLIQAMRFVAQPKWPLQHLGQSWPIGAMALWVAVIFAVLLLLGLVNS